MHHKIACNSILGPTAVTTEKIFYGNNKVVHNKKKIHHDIMYKHRKRCLIQKL